MIWKFSRIALILLLSFVFASCATTIDLKQESPSGSAKLVVTDSRSQQERTYRRDGVMSPIQYFGDEDFKTPPLRQFSILLENMLPSGSFALDVKQFRIIDVFPRRLNASISGGLTGALGSMGYSVAVDNAAAAKSDNIVCLISARFQSNAVSMSVSQPYQLSPLAGMLKKQVGFKDAVDECLSKLAKKVAGTAAG